MFSIRSLGIVLGLVVLAVQGQFIEDHVGLCNPSGQDTQLMKIRGDCKKFAVCYNGGYRFTQQCALDTIFDETAQRCLDPEAVTDADCTDVVARNGPPCLPGIRVHPTNCSMFYWCFTGTEYSLTCPDDTVFSSSRMVCVFPNDDRNYNAEDRKKCNPALTMNLQ